jgi:hypothetical protein
MAKGKKRIDVEQIKLFINSELSKTDDWRSRDYKAGLCDSLYHVLTTTGNYIGFEFLDETDCEHNTIGFWSRKYL